MQDVMKLSANPPEAGVLNGLVRPERQAGTVTAIKRKSLGRTECRSCGSHTHSWFTGGCLTCCGFITYSPGNSRRERRGWTRVTTCRFWGNSCREQEQLSLPCTMFELASLRFG